MKVTGTASAMPAPASHNAKSASTISARHRERRALTVMIRAAVKRASHNRILLSLLAETMQPNSLTANAALAGSRHRASTDYSAAIRAPTSEKRFLIFSVGFSIQCQLNIANAVTGNAATIASIHHVGISKRYVIACKIGK
jgi:hypothetical protein